MFSRMLDENKMPLGQGERALFLMAGLAGRTMCFHCFRLLLKPRKSTVQAVGVHYL